MATSEIADVTPQTVDRLGFFCCMSGPETEGYQQKLRWIKSRFREGLKLKMISRGGRGFIEYIPAEHGWRAVDAPGFLLIHCIWIVGKAKGHGCGKALLDCCIRDAKAQRMHGVVAVTAHGQLGLPETSFFLRHGFEVVDTAEPELKLVGLKLRKDAPSPHFYGPRKQQPRAVSAGLRVTYSAQCPFARGLVDNLVNLTSNQKIALRVVQLRSRSEVLKSAPSAYGTFAITHKGKLLSHLYHRMTGDRLRILMGRPDAKAITSPRF